MKRIITETITKEVEIEFPFYSKVSGSNNAFFAVLSEKEVWQVNTYDLHTGVDVTQLCHSNALSYEPCTKEEFLEAYDKAIKMVANLPIENPLFKEA